MKVVSSLHQQFLAVRIENLFEMDKSAI